MLFSTRRIRRNLRKGTLRKYTRVFDYAVMALYEVIDSFFSYRFQAGNLHLEWYADLSDALLLHFRHTRKRISALSEDDEAKIRTLFEK